MNETHSALADLRREVDEIDDDLHRLRMQRAGVVTRIAEAKQGDTSPPIRPGREAEILRRRCLSHHGPLQAAVLARLWREIISAFARCAVVMGGYSAPLRVGP